MSFRIAAESATARPNDGADEVVVVAQAEAARMMKTAGSEDFLVMFAISETTANLKIR